MRWYIIGKLTDAQKKKITADYVSGRTKTALASEYGVSRGTISRAIDRDPLVYQKIICKKEKNTQSVLEYMEENRERALEIINLYTKELLKPERIEKASVRELASILGMIIDKYAKNAGESAIDIEDLTPLGEMLISAKGRLLHEITTNH